GQPANRHEPVSFRLKKVGLPSGRVLGYPSLSHQDWRRTAGCPSGQRERSVKPSAQPTLVRTQHLPPPAKTARWLRILVAGGPFLSVQACVTLSRFRLLCRGVHGRI